ncbi:MAG: peptidase [Chitinophagaceae bacterium]|nr:peptidase [Chitinophagaceae bacterium]
MKKLLIASLFSPLLLQAQNNDSLFIRRIADNILNSRSAYNNLYQLTKTIGGRLAGSPQMVKAEKWGAAALKNAGANEVILQECMVPHWVRGGKDKTVVYYTDASGKKQSKELNILALGNSLGSGDKGVKAEIIEVRSFDELEQKKDLVKNKIIFYYGPFEETFVKTFQAYGKNSVYRGAGASRAAKYGAIGVLIRSMTHAMDNNPHTGAMTYNDSFPKIPAAAVGLRDVEWLDALLNKRKPVTALLVTHGKFLPDTIGHNVIGVLKGTEKPGEVITIGGHLDSWDVNEGAHDDGTGVVGTIEVLRAFVAAGYQPKHTIHFVLFANEENGARGGRQYAEAAKQNNEKHIFALESDEGGFTPRGFSLTAPDEAWNKINTWKYLFEPYGVYEWSKGGGGTDIGPLGRNLNTPMAGLQPDSQRYFDIHHAASDVFEAVNIREVKLGVINLAALIYLVDHYGL